MEGEPKALYSMNVERSVLGALILDPELTKSSDVDESDFYIHRHKWIWGALDTIVNSGGVPDYVSVCSTLDRGGKLVEIGGQAYILGLIRSVTTTMSMDTWCASLRDLARRRMVLEVTDAMVKGVFDHDRPLDDIVSTSFERIMRSTKSASGAVQIGHYVSKYYDMVSEHQQNPVDIGGMGTGLPDLDLMSDGIAKRELVIISGDPGRGKSLLAYQICSHMAEQGHPGAVYELEMPGEQVVGRQIATKAQIPTQTMLRGKIDDNQWGGFVDAIDYIAPLPIYMSDSTEWTTTGIRADCTRLKTLHGIEWVLVDYISLLQDLPNEKEWDRAAHCTRRLKALAKSLDVAVIAIASETKDGLDGEQPKNSHLRGGSGVPYDADKIWFLVKDTVELVVRVVPTKARESDKLGFVKLLKIEGFPAFGSMVKPSTSLPKPKHEPIVSD